MLDTDTGRRYVSGSYVYHMILDPKRFVTCTPGAWSLMETARVSQLSSVPRWAGVAQSV